MGYECVGVTMKLYEDIKGAEGVAKTLGIEHRVVDFSKEFRKFVVDPFVSSYERGETPNPCIECNRRIKFGLLYEYSQKMGFDTFVTGHYAKIDEWSMGIYRLKRAEYTDKDQSYFLYRLGTEELMKIWFPLGRLTKKEVRSIAEEAGLENAKERESQDICFISNGGHAEFIEKYRGAPLNKGNFVDSDGHVLGSHNGIERYTIGQRKGLGVALGRPVFVKEIRPETKEVVLADESEVFSSEIELTDVVWRRPAWSKTELKQMDVMSLRSEVVIRYKAKPISCSLGWSSGENVRVIFDEPARAPAIGQSAVFYDNDFVSGGGTITEVSGRI